MTGSFWGYLLIFVGSLSGCLLLTPFALRLALFFDIYDQPNGRKIHKSPVPHIGGVAIVTTFALAILIASWVARVPRFFPSLLITCTCGERILSFALGPLGFVLL